MEGFDLPEITPLELSDWLREKPHLVLLDVREPYEVSYAAACPTRAWSIRR